MKKTYLLALFIIVSIYANGQGASTLNENFNTSCATATNVSNGWTVYNPISSTIPPGEWMCTSTNGRPNASSAPTPGVTCTGVWAGNYHLDTSYLITPLLNVSTYTDSMYLEFDSKTTNINLGGRLALLATRVDSPYNYSTQLPYDDLTDTLIPTITVADSTAWVTHQLSLTKYRDSGNFYLTFRYTSTSTSGTAWFLDNVNITIERLNVANVHKDRLPLTVIGKSTSSQIALSYSISTAGKYRILIYDMMGRNVYDEQVLGQPGTASYTITGLNLHPGMYCVKMGNENAYGVTKLMIE